MTNNDNPDERKTGRWITDPATRAWLYAVSAATVPLLVTLGVLTAEVGGHALTIAGAVLSIAAPVLARANVDR